MPRDMRTSSCKDLWLFVIGKADDETLRNIIRNRMRFRFLANAEIDDIQ
jgi:hypothetical protein